MALITARASVERGRPPGLADGRCGSIIAQTASQTSVSYRLIIVLSQRPGGAYALIKGLLAHPLRASGPTRLMLMGGEPLDGPRHIFWNFVSSRKDRIDQAAEDWRARRFPGVPGDEVEFIPLPETPRLAA